ncbi:hypothetical protein LNTAR_21675 [Lentisphaera araneosa HTCC2155]|uniref:Uncharacterized protein n=1 Tax=Lentisphaera araneosa HTCC2155 TaxID=313628 RepID=A6DM69_9BACT|nr:hypothetical protein LNTAR_21675 [Lentisphaera araneosa HTCC2155]
MKSPHKRIILSSILIPIIGTILTISSGIYTSISEGEEIILIERLEGIPLLLIFAYFFVGCQSVLFSLALELVIQNRIKVEFQFYIISTILGFLLGMSLLHIYFGIIGAITGLIIGVIVRTNYLKHKTLTKDRSEYSRTSSITQSRR